ncbi:MAG: ABC transporter permease [Eubacterium sp.]|nr:ABC transporter permease [Eubacterium sp.]
MTLKTSSFKINPTIFRKNLTRFWPIWALYLAILVFMMPVAVYNNVRYVNADLSNEAFVKADKLSSMLQVLNLNLLPVVIAIFSIMAAVAVFSYLYMSRSCNMMHAFPVTRTEMFVTNYISGLLFLLVPQVVIFLMTAAVCVATGTPGISYLAIWLIFVIGLSFFFYSTAVFCCMLTGHVFPGFAFYFFFQVVYAVFANLIISLASIIGYGLGSVQNMGGQEGIPAIWLSPLVYLSLEDTIGFDCTMDNYVIQDITVHGGLQIGLYCIPAVILIVLSIWLYNRRHLECAAEMTAHKFVKPMTRWAVTIVGAIGLSHWFTSVFFSGSRYYVFIFAVMLVIASWIVFFLLEMAINKKFKIFKKIRFLEWGICIVAMIVVTGLVETDAFGVEKRQPDLAEVKGIVVYADHEMLVTEPEEMERIYNAHKGIIEAKEEYEAYEQRYVPDDYTWIDNGTPMDDDAQHYYTGYVRFEYIMADGSTFKRAYNIPADVNYMSDAASPAAQIRALQMETNSYVKSWMVVNYEDVELTGGVLYKYDAIGESQVEVGQEEVQVLYNAILKDIAENNHSGYFGDSINEDNEWFSVDYTSAHLNLWDMSKEEPVELWSLIDALYEEDESEAASIAYQQTYAYVEDVQNGYRVDVGFDIYGSCVHTIQALLDLGIIEDASELTGEVEYPTTYKE